VSTTSAKSGPSIAVSRQTFVKSASTHSFFLRGRTTWGVDIRKPINIQYEDPCGKETISIHGGVKQMLWNEEKRKGEFKKGVGLTEDNRYTLWYGLKGGKTVHNLFAADFAGIGYNEHLMSTNVLSTCCPVTGYRMFKDDQGQAIPKYDGTEVALQKEDLLDQARIVIDNAAMEALPYKEQTFVLQGVTSNANTGTAVGVHKQPMFYMKVAFSECFPSQQNTDFAFDIQAVGVAQKPLGKFAQDFFTVGVQGCEIVSYHLEDRMPEEDSELSSTFNMGGIYIDKENKLIVEANADIQNGISKKFFVRGVT